MQISLVVISWKCYIDVMGHKRTLWGHVNILYVDPDGGSRGVWICKIYLEVYLRFVYFRVHKLHPVKEMFKIK